jgi:hypothetical protein
LCAAYAEAANASARSASSRHHQRRHGDDGRLDEGPPVVSFEQIVDGVEGDQGPAEQKLEGRAVSNDFWLASPVR